MNFFTKLFRRSNNPTKIMTETSGVESTNSSKEILNESSISNIEIERQEESNRLTGEDKVKLIEQIAKAPTKFLDMSSDLLGTQIEQCARLIVESGSGSTSMLQRRFNLGYNKAGRIMEILTEIGVVSYSNFGKPRELLIHTQSELDSILKTRGLLFKVDIHKFIKENSNEIAKRQFELEREAIEQQNQFEREAIKQVILERERKKNMEREVYQELLNTGLITASTPANERRRESIPQDVMNAVWNRDGGRCVLCGSQENIEFDHIIPFSKGGSNTYRNLQILCKTCNLDKSNKIG